MDLYLTPAEISNMMDITVQGFHKFCRENGLELAKDSNKLKIYPSLFNRILEKRGINRRKKRRISVHNVKGGVGKTTIAHALATRLSTLGFKVLVIDLDKQANLTNSFGIDDEQGYPTLLELYNSNINEDKKLSANDVIISISDYLHLIPADLSLSNFDLAIQVNLDNIIDLFSNLLKDISDNYDTIIFDLPADFNRVTLAAHHMCDLAIIPVHVSNFSQKGLKLTKRHIELVNKKYGGSIDYKIVVNQLDARHSSSFDVIADLKVEYGKEGHLCNTLIPVSKPIETTMDKSESIWRLPRGKAAALDGFDNLVSELFDLETWRQKPSRSIRREEVGESYV